MSNDQRRASGNKIILGIAHIAVALMTYAWARNHSPHMGFFEAVQKLNGYVIKEPLYSGVLIVAAIIGVIGVITIVKGLMAAKQ